MKESIVEGRRTLLSDLHRHVQGLRGDAAVLGLEDIAQMSGALEPVLLKLRSKTALITHSSMRTLTHAIDFVAELLNKRKDLGLLRAAPVRVLVVDDDTVSLRTVCYQLEQTQMPSEAVGDS